MLFLDLSFLMFGSNVRSGRLLQHPFQLSFTVILILGSKETGVIILK